MSAFVEVAAVMGGVSALFLCFALVQVASRRMLMARLDTFVKSDAHAPSPTIRRQTEEPQTAIIQRMNRRLRRASLALWVARPILNPTPTQSAKPQAVRRRPLDLGPIVRPWPRSAIG